MQGKGRWLGFSLGGTSNMNFLHSNGKWKHSYIKHKHATWDKNINYMRGKGIVAGETSENFWHVVDVIIN